jgi:hypothetical protein
MNVRNLLLRSELASLVRLVLASSISRRLTRDAANGADWILIDGGECDLEFSEKIIQ